MANDVIREFLIALGYELDESSEKKFLDAVERVSGNVVELGKNVVATAVAIQVGVSKMANDFERLYYAGQRTKSAVSSLQAVEYAAKTIGLTSDQARGSVESLMASMRNNPGISALLNQLGVQTRGRQGTEIFDDAIQRLSKMPFFLARRYASLLGIEDGVLVQLINNYKRFAEARDNASKRRKDAGLDPKKQSEDAVAYNNALRSLMLSLDILSERIYSGFIGPATWVVTKLDDLTQGFIAVDKATSGWAGTIGTIATTSLGVYLAKLLLMKTLFRGIAVEAAAAGAAATVATGAAAATGAGAAAGGGLLARLAAGRRSFVAPRTMAALMRALVGKGGGLMGGALMAMLAMKYDDNTGNHGRTWLRKKFGIKDEDDEKTTAPFRKETAPDKKETAPTGMKTRVVEFFMGKGWSREQATGITANLHSESKLDERAVGDGGRAYGVAQWHPDRQEKFREWANKDIRDSTLEDQLGFVHHELTKGAEQFAGAMLKKAEKAGDAGAVVSKFYERPADTKGEMDKRGSLAQSWHDAYLGASGRSTPAPVINQKTDIHLPTSDPQVAGKKVADAQNQVNAEIVRNMGAVTR